MSIHLLAAGALVVAAAVFGGASQNARVPLMSLEMLSLPVLWLATQPLVARGLRREVLWPILLLLSIITVPVVQCIPLPPELWLKAPGLQPRFTATILAGLDLDWAPLSLDPTATLAAIPALFPPAAMLLITFTLNSSERRSLAAVWLVLALLGLMLGLAQVTEVRGGPAFLYSQTSVGYLVGWFANRNHEAAMLLALLPIAAVLVAARGVPGWIAAVFLLLVVVALAVNKSRAGIVLAAPVAALSLGVYFRAHGRAQAKLALLIFLGVTALSVLAVSLLALTPILTRFGPESAPEFRYKVWPLIWNEALLHLPFGSGIGSFDRVYRAIEPLDFVEPRYFNHAHNDYLELFVEAGWLGVAAVFGLLTRFSILTTIAWRQGGSSLARAASVGILVLAATSWVDYPLRTEALATLLAYLFGVMSPVHRGSALT